MQPRLGVNTFDALGHFLVLSTVAFTVYGQLITKQQVGQLSQIPSGIGAILYLVQQILVRPLLLSGFVAAFAAALCWMGAISRFDISYAYPFMSLNFVLVAAISVPLFGETLTLQRLFGLAFICTGVIITSRG